MSDVQNAIQALQQMAKRQSYFKRHFDVIINALNNAPAVDSKALEHRDLAMALSAALVEHVGNSIEGECDFARLREFQEAARQEINRLYAEVFNRTPFEK